VPHPSLLGWPALALLFFGLSKRRWHRVALGAFGVLLALAVVMQFSYRAAKLPSYTLGGETHTS
jgi:hypothetical protein